MPVPLRAITSVSVLAGVVTFGVVLVASAPPSPSERMRELSERASRSREMTDTIKAALEQGRLEAADRLTHEQIRLFPEDPNAWVHYALVRQRVGDHEGAAQGWARLLDLTEQVDNGRARPGRLILHAWALHGQGLTREAFRLWSRAADLGAGNTGSAEGLYQVAREMALDDEREDALRLLHFAVDAGYRSAYTLRTDEAFEPLRDHPRYRSALDRVLRRRMGGNAGHAETEQIRALPLTPRQRLEAWTARWGDI
ncbi:MAG: TPR end-of-group domain-containing protein [Phycisphaerales bacterium JB059]